MYYWIFLLRRGANLTFFSLFLIYFLLFNFTSPDLELSRFPPRTRHIDQRNAAARRQNSTRGRAHCFFFFFVKKKEIDILLSFLFDRRRMHESVHRLPPFIFFFQWISLFPLCFALPRLRSCFRKATCGFKKKKKKRRVGRALVDLVCRHRTSTWWARFKESPTQTLDYQKGVHKRI